MSLTRRWAGVRATGRRPQAMFKDHAVGRVPEGRGLPLLPARHRGSSPRGRSPSPTRTSRWAPTSEFETVFNDTTIMPAIDRVLGNTTPELTFRDRHREGTLFELRQLQRVSDGAGPQVRVRAHPAAPRPVRVQGGRLAPHGGRGEGHTRSTLYAEPPRVREHADQGDRRLPAVGSGGHPPDRHHRGRRGPADVPERRLRHGRAPTTCASGWATCVAMYLPGRRRAAAGRRSAP